MKRDLDLQTNILQRLEQAGPDEEVCAVEGYSHNDFCYNARQLARAGLIDIIDAWNKPDPLACIATGLTPAGHDLLDQARTERRRKVIAAGSHAAQITFETVLRGLLEGIMRGLGA